MTEYTVHFKGYASTWAPKIQADNPEDAIEKAYHFASPFICHQCASGSRGSGGIELGDEWEPTAVFDEGSGKCVWTED